MIDLLMGQTVAEALVASGLAIVTASVVIVLIHMRLTRQIKTDSDFEAKNAQVKAAKKLSKFIDTDLQETVIMAKK